VSAGRVYRIRMSHLVLEQGDTPFTRRLRRRRLHLALGIAAIEAILVLAGVLPWWSVAVLAAAAVAAYAWLGRRHRSPLVRAVTWVAAVSQLVVVLVPVGIVLVGVLALVVLVAVAVVALAVLLLDRR
jgi:hypothetical protein